MALPLSPVSPPAAASTVAGAGRGPHGSSNPAGKLEGLIALQCSDVDSYL